MTREADGGGNPFNLARPAITTFEHVLGCRRRPPLRCHVEQAYEEIVAQRFSLPT